MYDNYKKTSEFVGCASLFYLITLCLGAAGWVMNIIKIVHSVNDPITGMFIARCVGVIVAPVGAVLGWFVR